MTHLVHLNWLVELQKGIQMMKILKMQLSLKRMPDKTWLIVFLDFRDGNIAIGEGK